MRTLFLVVLLSSPALAQQIMTTTGERTKLTVTFEPAVERGQRLFQMFCHHCHGAAGDGRGHMSGVLSPDPLDFSLHSVSEERIIRVVREGSAPSGGSPFMISWRELLRDEDIRDVAAYTAQLAARRPTQHGVTASPSSSRSAPSPSGSERLLLAR